MAVKKISVSGATPTTQELLEILHALGTGSYYSDGVPAKIFVLDQNNYYLDVEYIPSPSDWQIDTSTSPPKAKLIKTLTMLASGKLTTLKITNINDEALFVTTLSQPINVNSGDKVDISWAIWIEGVSNIVPTQLLLLLMTGNLSLSLAKVVKATLLYGGQAKETVSVSMNTFNINTRYGEFIGNWTPSSSYSFDSIQLKNSSDSVLFTVKESGSVTAGTSTTLKIGITATT